MENNLGPQHLTKYITDIDSKIARMEPALRPQFLVDEIEHETVVAAEINEIPAAQKTVFLQTGRFP